MPIRKRKAKAAKGRGTVRCADPFVTSIDRWNEDLASEARRVAERIRCRAISEQRHVDELRERARLIERVADAITRGKTINLTALLDIIRPGIAFNLDPNAPTENQRLRALLGDAPAAPSGARPA